MLCLYVRFEDDRKKGGFDGCRCCRRHALLPQPSSSFRPSRRRVFDVVMYASPLAIWKNVVSTRSVEDMPFWLSFAVLSNGMYWTVYALVQFDIVTL
ncbi:hypothetical protein V6N11_054472 [Hibiscus sabdariffa]|uniref:Uncharacterized protein n=1 Tax=Hibiscus sabdariffa TaxID=183260 RepID=A0ABR2S4N1_9ROSI